MSDSDCVWKRLICSKYGKEELGWSSKEVMGAFGVGLWKEILKESNWVRKNWIFRVDNGSRVRFSTDPWCSSSFLGLTFPTLYAVAVNALKLWWKCGIRWLETCTGT